MLLRGLDVMFVFEKALAELNEMDLLLKALDASRKLPPTTALEDKVLETTVLIIVCV